MVLEELTERLKNVYREMEKEKFDCFIVSSEENIWYLTNITYKPEERPFFIVIAPNEKPTLIVPKLEEEHMKKGVLDCEVRAYWEYPAPEGERWHDILLDHIKKYHRIGIETHVRADILHMLDSKEIIQSPLIDELRKIKSPYEINKIRFSSYYAVKAMEKIVNSAYLGQSVLEPFTLSRPIQQELIKRKEYDPITTSLLTVLWPAPISAMPHAIPNLNDKIPLGPNIAMSYFRINGYASECERTLFLGVPTQDDIDHFRHMMTARRLALNTVKPGVRTADVDYAAKNYLVQKGYKENLLHRTGHGIGLGNHEAPFMAEGSDDVLQENMVISIEPGIYLPGVGGFRHSDTILITKNGYEILTPYPVELKNLKIKKPRLLKKLKGKMIQKALNL